MFLTQLRNQTLKVVQANGFGKNLLDDIGDHDVTDGGERERLILDQESLTE